MYIWSRPGLGGWQGVTLAMRPKPDVMLDQFILNKATLTPRLATMVNTFADAVIKSQQSSQPIQKIRLVGHTDNSGEDQHNQGLGQRRAGTVEAMLRARLKALPGVQIVSSSKGEIEPRVENDSPDHRAHNRRVEVFVTTAPPPPPAKQPSGANLWDWRGLKPPEKSIIETTPSPYWQQPPPAKPRGRSVSQWLDEVLAPLPGWLARRIRDAVLKGSCAALELALSQAVGKLSGKEQEDLRKECLEAANRKVQ
jgi:hypothetical protein